MVRDAVLMKNAKTSVFSPKYANLRSVYTPIQETLVIYSPHRDFAKVEQLASV
jgi:hypothetical protein